MRVSTAQMKHYHAKPSTQLPKHMHKLYFATNVFVNWAISTGHETRAVYMYTYTISGYTTAQYILSVAVHPGKPTTNLLAKVLCY